MLSACGEESVSNGEGDQNNTTDTTPPEISLLGADPYIVDTSSGAAFVDPGATATDDVDGDISANILVGGDTVDSATPGTYVLTYDVSDTAGNAASQVTRRVVVLDDTPVGVTDTTPPVITLLGANPFEIDSSGESFIDPGATATDDVDGNISASIRVGGDTVDSTKPGSYLLTYNVSDAAGNAAIQVTRRVVVSDGTIDTTPPEITLLGANPLEIDSSSNEPFADPGATATDNIDGDISANIVVGGDTVDTSTPGTYVLTYDVSDAAGNGATQVTRRVVVVDVGGNGGAQQSFTGFTGAPEDQALVDTLIANHLSVSEPKRIIYVAPLFGSADGSGATREDPRRNLKAALQSASPGDHFYLAPGVYRIDEARDTFGTAGSLIILRNSGTREDKIVVRTDPDLWDPQSGAVAQIDFGFDNSQGTSDRHSIALYASHWVFEQLEIRNFNDWGFYITGSNNLINECEIHHDNQPGKNNTGLIVFATSGPSYNLVMNSHLHHSGNLDAGGELIGSEGGLNGGCTYSVTRQSYDNNTDSLGADPTWEEVQSVLAPADSEVYYFNNLVHHCHGNGLGTKNAGADGPFYFLSNVIHTSGNGIKASLNHSVVRNNIIYAGEWMDNAMLWGWSPSTDLYAQIANAVGISVENNTFVGTPVGIAHRGGWNGVLRNNLFIDIAEPHRLIATWYSWHNGWPWVVGEYVYGDLNSEHPYFYEMPTALQSRAGHYFRLEAQGNVYSDEPLITADVVGGLYDLRGSTLSSDHTVLSVEDIESHLQNPADDDFRRSTTNPGPIGGVGSAIQ